MLVRFLKQVLTPMRTMDELYPHKFTVLQLSLEVGIQVIFLLDGNELVAHIRQGLDKSLLQYFFTLCHTFALRQH